MEAFAALRKRAGSVSMSDSLSGLGASTKGLFSSIATKTNELVASADPSQLANQPQQAPGAMRQAQTGGIKKAISISDVSEQSSPQIMSSMQMGAGARGFYDDANSNYRGGSGAAATGVGGQQLQNRSIMAQQQQQQQPQMGQDFRQFTSAMNAMSDSDQPQSFSSPQPQRMGYSSRNRNLAGAVNMQGQPSPQQPLMHQPPQQQFSPNVQQQQHHQQQQQQQQQQFRNQQQLQQNQQVAEIEPVRQPQQNNSGPMLGGFLGGLKNSVGGIINSQQAETHAVQQQQQPQPQQQQSQQYQQQQQGQNKQGGAGGLGGLFGGLKNVVKDEGMLGQFKTFVTDNEIVSQLKEGTGDVVGSLKSAVDIGGNNKPQQQQQLQQQQQQPQQVETIPPEAALLGKVHRETPVTPYMQQQQQQQDYLLQKAPQPQQQQQQLPLKGMQQDVGADLSAAAGRGRAQNVGRGQLPPGQQQTQLQQQRQPQQAVGNPRMPMQQQQQAGRGMQPSPLQMGPGQQQRMPNQAMARGQQPINSQAMNMAIPMDDPGELSDPAADIGDTASEDSSYSSSPQKASEIRSQYQGAKGSPDSPSLNQPVRAKIRPGSQQHQALMNDSSQQSPKAQHPSQRQQDYQHQMNVQPQSQQQQQQQQHPSQQVPDTGNGGFDYTSKYQQKVANKVNNNGSTMGNVKGQQAPPQQQQQPPAYAQHQKHELAIDTNSGAIDMMAPVSNAPLRSGNNVNQMQQQQQQQAARRMASQQIVPSPTPSGLDAVELASNSSETMMEPVIMTTSAGRGNPNAGRGQMNPTGRGRAGANDLTMEADAGTQMPRPGGQMRSAPQQAADNNKVPMRGPGQQQQQQQNQPNQQHQQQFESVEDGAVNLGGNRQRMQQQQVPQGQPGNNSMQNKPGAAVGRGVTPAQQFQQQQIPPDQQEPVAMALSSQRSSASSIKAAPLSSSIADGQGTDFSIPSSKQRNGGGGVQDFSAATAAASVGATSVVGNNNRAVPQQSAEQIDLSTVRRKSTSSENPPIPSPMPTLPQQSQPVELEGVLNLSSGKKRQQTLTTAAGSSAPSPAFTSADNLFDQSVSDEVRQIGQFIEDFLKRIFDETGVVEEVEIEFVENAFSQNAYHRRVFVRTIEAKRGDRRILQPIVFFRLVRLFTSSLLSAGDLADFVTARSLMNMSFTFRCELPNHVSAQERANCKTPVNATASAEQQFYRIWLYDFLKGSPIFRCEQFWEEALSGLTASNTTGRNRGRPVDPNVVFGQLSGLCRNMRSIGLEREFVHLFIRKNAADFSDEQIFELLDNAEPWPNMVQ